MCACVYVCVCACVCVRVFWVPCRDLLRRHYHLKEYNLEVDLDHLGSFHSELAERLKAKPADFLPIVRGCNN